MGIHRKITREIKIGREKIGGENPVLVQSMASRGFQNPDELFREAKRLEAAGCRIFRVAVPDELSALGIADLKKEISMPVVADIHFDYRLALLAVKAGADKIRINPGNIGDREKIKAVADLCGEREIPIRIGVNSGSLEEHILEKYRAPTADALVESALYHVSLLEELRFYDIAISIKSSDVLTTIEGYQKLSRACGYPLHLGVTEAGGEKSGVVKSAVALGALLSEGIGDTLRVSLTADPVREVEAGYEILRALGLYKGGVEVISCPTCGRCRIDLFSLAKKVEDAVREIKTPLKIAVMGCAVNGPGEARGADLGVAGGDGEGILFKHGKILFKVPEEEILPALLREIHKLDGDKV